MPDHRDSPSPDYQSDNFDGARIGKGSFWPTPPDEWVFALRDHMRDFARSNDLLDFHEESTDKQLRDAWGKALVDWNTTPPLIPAVTFLAHPARGLLITRAAIEVMQSVSFDRMRNELEFNAGNVTYNTRNQWQKYERKISSLSEEYENKKSAIKVSINIGRGFGESFSEFARIGMGLDQAT